MYIRNKTKNVLMQETQCHIYTHITWLMLESSTSATVADLHPVATDHSSPTYNFYSFWPCVPTKHIHNIYNLIYNNLIFRVLRHLIIVLTWRRIFLTFSHWILGQARTKTGQPTRASLLGDAAGCATPW